VEPLPSTTARLTQQPCRLKGYGVREDVCRFATGQQLIQHLRRATESLHPRIELDRDRQAGEALGVGQVADGRAEVQLAILRRVALRRSENQPGPAHLAGLVNREIRKLIRDRRQCVGHRDRPQPVRIRLDHRNQTHAGLAPNSFGSSANMVQVDYDAYMPTTHGGFSLADLRVRTESAV